jgi:hypothetical protein
MNGAPRLQAPSSRENKPNDSKKGWLGGAWGPNPMMDGMHAILGAEDTINDGNESRFDHFSLSV